MLKNYGKILTCFLMIYTILVYSEVQNVDSDDDLFWTSQKKYMVDPRNYYGSMPNELELAVYVEKNKQEFTSVGLNKSSNYIFYGPPGVGKTYVASIFAQRIGAEFMYVQGSDLQGSYIGDSFKKPEVLFKKARARRDKMRKPVVMFIDEIDTVIGDRERIPSHYTASHELVGSVLKEIGSDVNNNIIVVAATNYLNSLDNALLRSGRFGNHIKFSLPSLQDRMNFCLFLVRSYKYIFDSKINWYTVAEKMHGRNYADIKKIIDNFKVMYVLRKINKDSKKLVITEEDIWKYLGCSVTASWYQYFMNLLYKTIYRT